MEADYKDNSKLGLDYSIDTTIGYVNTSTLVDQIKRIRPGFCVLSSDPNRAISESVITSIVNQSCEPIIRFSIPLNQKPQDYEIEAILSAYAHWGVKRAIFFDRPNDIANWGSEAWLQGDLINRFLDRLILINQMAAESGIILVFPPLNPLGNYPDLSFFRLCMENLLVRNPAIFDSLELSIFGWTHKHDLNWGAGGESSHPSSFCSIDTNIGVDHKCFRISDWYDQLCLAIIQKTLPIHMLQAGLISNRQTTPEWENMDVIRNIVALTKSFLDSDEQQILPLGSNISSCNLALPNTNHELSNPLLQDLIPSQTEQDQKENKSLNCQTKESDLCSKPIKAYVLLPSFEWGVSDWYLEAIKPFVKKHKPAVGFSLEEAKLANHVIVINDQNSFSSIQIDELRACDCIVEEFDQLGTSVATKLSAR